MEFINEIFVGGSIKDLGTIKYSLSRNIPVLNLYCICLFDGDKMQIVPSRSLCTDRYKQKKFLVAGLASSMQEAKDLIMFMIDNAIKTGRDYKMPKEWIY